MSMESETGVVIASPSSDRRRFFKSVLEGAGYLAFQAVDRAHSMRLLERHQISVIISDRQLPDGDWRDFLSGTAGMAQPPRLIVVAADAGRDLWAEVLNLGGSEVLIEPLNEEEIRRAVDMAVGAWSAGREPVLRKAAAASASAASPSSASIFRPELEHAGQGNAPGKAPREAILVIDDDPNIRKFLHTVLRREGYEVLLADSGPQGIETFRRCAERVLLVLLDCEMPEMNGDCVFDQLKAIHPEVKVIVSSGRSPCEILSLFAGRSVADFLPKPFTPTRLNETIRSALAA